MEKVVQIKKHSNDLGDFTTTPRLLTVSALAVAIGILAPARIPAIAES
jgi:hypothetical protein